MVAVLVVGGGEGVGLVEETWVTVGDTAMWFCSCQRVPAHHTEGHGEVSARSQG